MNRVWIGTCALVLLVGCSSSHSDDAADASILFDATNIDQGRDGGTAADGAHVAVCGDGHLDPGEIQVWGFRGDVQGAL